MIVNTAPFFPAFTPAQTAPANNRVDKKQNGGGAELSDQEKAELARLKERDREVRQHEQAHLAAAGQYARSSASFEYERGPDGKNYAVGGEVSIDTSEVPGDPEATLQKAEQIRRAANAPASPSSQDRAVAAEAAAMAIKARIALSRQTGEAE